MKTVIPSAAAIIMASVATPALADTNYGGPMEIGDGVTLDPIIDARLRYETVDQDNAVDNADAITLRLRAGAELKTGNLAILVEGEGTLALINDYNAFPFPAEDQNRPYSVVADPENIELNRAQISYFVDGNGVTLGRQRINLDDQRWVGSVGWRQNEQTFDAVRGQAKFGPVTVDATYAFAQRTIFGIDAGGRQAYDGDMFFLGAGADIGPLKLKAFSYLLDYDDPLFLANSSQTYGVLATAKVPVGPKAKLKLKASYARQSDWRNPVRGYSADYIALEAGASYSGFTLTGGYELLGSDNGFGLQTPLATMHKFNGFTDLFLNTPGAGLQDLYIGAGYKFPKIEFLPGLKAGVTYHDFNSDVGSIDYGSEIDAVLGFKIGPFGILAKYANYNAKSFNVDTEKFSLQAAISF